MWTDVEQSLRPDCKASLLSYHEPKKNTKTNTNLTFKTIGNSKTYNINS